MTDWYRSSLGEFEEAAVAASGDGRTTPEWLRDAEQHLRDKPSRPSNDGTVEAEELPLETVRGAVRRLMLSAGEVIDGSSDEAFELLVALEHILGHGFKRRSTLLAALSPGGPERPQQEALLGPNPRPTASPTPTLALMLARCP